METEKRILTLRKNRRITIGVLILVVILLAAFLFFSRNNHASIGWMNDLNYNADQLHGMTFSLFNPCPKIPVKFGEKEIPLLFDTGNAPGLFLTTAVDGRLDYEITGTTTEYEADGSLRGQGKSIVLKDMAMFGDRYTDVPSSLTDWRMYGFFQNNGAIGLHYFANKIVTLDYPNARIAVTDTPLDYTKIDEQKYVVLPLIRSQLPKEKDLIFFEIMVNGKASTVYMDTGSTRSFVRSEEGKTGVADVVLGAKEYHFRGLKPLENSFTDEFAVPLRLALNSDLLKSFGFVVTFDLIQDKLILCQN